MTLTIAARGEESFCDWLNKESRTYNQSRVCKREDAKPLLIEGGKVTLNSEKVT